MEDDYQTVLSASCERPSVAALHLPTRGVGPPPCFETKREAPAGWLGLSIMGRSVEGGQGCAVSTVFDDVAKGGMGSPPDSSTARKFQRCNMACLISPDQQLRHGATILSTVLRIRIALQCDAMQRVA